MMKFDEIVERIKDSMKSQGRAFIPVETARELNRVGNGLGSLCMTHRWIYKRVKTGSDLIEIIPNNRRY